MIQIDWTGFHLRAFSISGQSTKSNLYWLVHGHVSGEEGDVRGEKPTKTSGEYRTDKDGERITYSRRMHVLLSTM